MELAKNVLLMTNVQVEKFVILLGLLMYVLNVMMILIAQIQTKPATQVLINVIVLKLHAKLIMMD